MEPNTKTTPSELIGLSLLSKLGNCCARTADKKVREAGYQPDFVAVMNGLRVPLWSLSKLPEICRIVFPHVDQTELFKGAKYNVR